MRISIIGNGRMGQAVQRLAGQEGVDVVRILGRDDNPAAGAFEGQWVSRSDVLIDFSTANAVEGNVEKAMGAGLPIVIGVTGWSDRLEQVRSRVQALKGACLYGSNFSLGVQVLFWLVRRGSRILSRLEGFDPFIWEAHHNQKVDAPSGTALTLRDIIREEMGSDVQPASVRAGHIPGTHIVGFDSAVDTLQIEHRARNRDGFAAGALLAAQWLVGKQGFFSMEDLIEESFK